METEKLLEWTDEREHAKHTLWNSMFDLTIEIELEFWKQIDTKATETPTGEFWCVIKAYIIKAKEFSQFLNACNKFLYSLSELAIMQNTTLKESL